MSGLSRNFRTLCISPLLTSDPTYLSNDVFFVLFRAAELATQGKFPTLLSRSDSQKAEEKLERSVKVEREQKEGLDSRYRGSLIDRARQASSQMALACTFV